MTEREQTGPGPSVRALSAALVVAGLLLFSWPFVRSPPLGLPASYAHLLGSWAVLIAAIALTARSLGRRGGEGDA